MISIIYNTEHNEGLKVDIPNGGKLIKFHISLVSRS